ncbi:MAG: hypothetical protein R3Y11_07975 [Pseudomonadota bacterium]
MQDTYCTCGYVLRAAYEMDDQRWKTKPANEGKSFHLDTCPLCGAPIAIHLVR